MSVHSENCGGTEEADDDCAARMATLRVQFESVADKHSLVFDEEILEWARIHCGLGDKGTSDDLRQWLTKHPAPPRRR